MHESRDGSKGCRNRTQESIDEAEAACKKADMKAGVTETSGKKALIEAEV